MALEELSPGDSDITDCSLCCPLPPSPMGCVRVTDPPILAPEWIRNSSFPVALLPIVCSIARHTQPAFPRPRSPVWARRPVQTPGHSFFASLDPCAFPHPCPGFFQGKGCLDPSYLSGGFWSHPQRISNSENHFSFPNSIFKLFRLLSKWSQGLAILNFFHSVPPATASSGLCSQESGSGPLRPPSHPSHPWSPQGLSSASFLPPPQQSSTLQLTALSPSAPTQPASR